MGCTPPRLSQTSEVRSRAFDYWSALICIRPGTGSCAMVVALVPAASRYSIRMYLLLVPRHARRCHAAANPQRLHSPGAPCSSQLPCSRDPPALAPLALSNQGTELEPESTEEGMPLGTRYLMPATPAVPVPAHRWQHQHLRKYRVPPPGLELRFRRLLGFFVMSLLQSSAILLFLFSSPNHLLVFL
jgi:hypothetical protein